MVSKSHIHRSASMTIDRYGDTALLEAMRRIEEFRLAADDMNMSVWGRIADAIEWRLMPRTFDACLQLNEAANSNIKSMRIES